MKRRDIAAATQGDMLCLPFPIRGRTLAQIVVPRDMTRAEAERLCAFVMSLAAVDAARAGSTS